MASSCLPAISTRPIRCARCVRRPARGRGPRLPRSRLIRKAAGCSVCARPAGANGCRRWIRWPFKRPGTRRNEAMYLRYRIIAHELHEIWASTAIARRWSMWPDPTHTRSCKTAAMASTPTAVAEIGRAVADGHLDGGVLPVVKHISRPWPGGGGQPSGPAGGGC